MPTYAYQYLHSHSIKLLYKSYYTFHWQEIFTKVKQVLTIRLCNFVNELTN